MSLNNSKKVMLFHANWCSHCVDFKPTWEKLTEYFHDNDIKYSDHEASDKDIMNKYSIKSFPTIKIQTKNNISDYTGTRDYDSIVQAVNVQNVQNGGSFNRTKVYENNYNKIIDPKTGKKYSIFSNKGKLIIKYYIKNLMKN
tara:strand:+ start:244 stop:669 length:426 start_codon:yes stop_codon:yes gene_type:complete